MIKEKGAYQSTQIGDSLIVAINGEIEDRKSVV